MKKNTRNKMARKFSFVNFNEFAPRVGEGWSNLIEKYLIKIDKEQGEDENFYILGISNDNGRLVAFSSGENANTEKLIAEMENESLTICQVCGKIKETVSENEMGWCKNCYDEIMIA